MSQSHLDLEIKQLIIKVLHLEDMTAADIDSEAPLFGTGLGLDSIDALELGIALKKKYNFSIELDEEDNRKCFATVNNLVAYISAQQAGT